METNRLYARTAAKIELRWIEAVAGELIQIRHSEPFWSSLRGRRPMQATQRAIWSGDRAALRQPDPGRSP